MGATGAIRPSHLSLQAQACCFAFTAHTGLPVTQFSPSPALNLEADTHRSLDPSSPAPSTRIDALSFPHRSNSPFASCISGIL